MPLDFADLVELAHQDGLRVARAIARVRAALGDPEAMREGERWDVDLAIPRLTLTAEDEVIFGGPCQLVGTVVPGDGFLWGFANPSVTETGWQTLKAALQAMPEVAPYLSQRAWPVDELSRVEWVAAWLSARAGYTGCFVAPRDGATAFLAVDLTGPAALGEGHEPWCSSCGRLRRAVARLVAGPEGINVCSECGAILADVLAAGAPESGQAAPEPLGEGASPLLRFCLFCGEPRGGLIMMQSAGICRDCARLCVEIFAAPSGG